MSLSFKPVTRLVLHIPDLFWPEPEDPVALGERVCPTLETLIARGALRKTGQKLSTEHLLLRTLGFPMDTAVAAIRYLGEGVQGRREALRPVACADPVYLKFHQAQVILGSPDLLALTPEESRCFVDDLNATFGDVAQFEGPHPNRWYVWADDPLWSALFQQQAPLSEMAGRRIAGAALHASDLESASPAHRRFRQWQNELQMFLHGHPLNGERQAQGKLPLNGIWFWGGGALNGVSPRSRSGPWSCLRGAPENVFLQGLAQGASLPWEALPSTLDSFCAEPLEGHVLCCLDVLSPACRADDSDAWKAALSHLETACFSPLLRGRQAFSIETSGVYGSFSISSDAYQGWQVWRRPRPLAETLKQFAHALGR